MDLEISRRQAIAAGGGLGAVGVLGLGTRHWLRSPDAPEPVVPEAELARDGWERTDESVDSADIGSAGPFSITSETHMMQYERTSNEGREPVATVRYRDEQREEPIEYPVAGPPNLLTARAVSISPHAFDLPGGQIKNGATVAVRQDLILRFAVQLDRLGFQVTDTSDGETESNGSNREETAENQDVDADSGTLETESGHTAELLEFQATYPVESVEVPITDDRTRTVSGPDIPVTCLIALWQPGSHFMSAAGTYPSENLTWDETDEIDGDELRINVDLDLSPLEREENLSEYLGSVGR